MITVVAQRYVEQEIAGDDITALSSVLQADVWRHKLLTEATELNAKLELMEKIPATDIPAGHVAEKDELSLRLGDVQQKLVDMDAESAPARAGLLLAGLGFSETDQKLSTKSFSGGWRMRLALARALFVKPDVSASSIHRN